MDSHSSGSIHNALRRAYSSPNSCIHKLALADLFSKTNECPAEESTGMEAVWLVMLMSPPANDKNTRSTRSWNTCVRR